MSVRGGCRKANGGHDEGVAGLSVLNRGKRPTEWPKATMKSRTQRFANLNMRNIMSFFMYYSCIHTSDLRALGWLETKLEQARSSSLDTTTSDRHEKRKCQASVN